MRYLWIIALFTSALSAQTWPIIDDSWTLAKFHQSEGEVQLCIQYLLEHDCSTDPIERFEAVRFIDQWTTWVPYITFELENYLLKAIQDSPEMLGQYLCVKLDYYFKHPSTEINRVAVELISVNGMLDLYSMGGCVSNKTLDNWLKLRNDGQLEDFIKSKVPLSWE